MKKILASLVFDLFVDTLMVLGLIISLLSMLFSFGSIISIVIEPSFYDTFLGVFSTSASISLFFTCLVFLGSYFQRKKSDFKKIIFALSVVPFAFYAVVLTGFLLNNL